MLKQNALAFTVVDIIYFDFFLEALRDYPNTELICNKHGDLKMIRFKFGSATRWLINVSVWLPPNEVDDKFLTDLNDFYEWLGIGTCITPGAAGHQMQMLLWQKERMRKQSNVSVSIENFLRKNCTSGVVNTLQFGSYEELVKLDEASNYLAYFNVEPSGAGVWFNAMRGGSEDRYVTYFAECAVRVNSELAMGIFPTKSRVGKILYPTLPGTYYTFLWKEQVNLAREYGCQVGVGAGVGWRSFSTDPSIWSKEIYRKRKTATNERIERWCKLASVGGIGHHGMTRYQYHLTPDLKNANTKITIITESGEPLAYGVVETLDESGSYLLHWQRYTAAMAGLSSITFALPIAEEGRLVQIYHDSVLVIERDETHSFIARKSNEALLQEPGTWLWEILTGVTVDKSGNVSSNEYQRYPGQKRRVPTIH